MEYSVVINLIVTVLLLGGIWLTLLGLPGNIMIFLTAVGYGYYDHFVHLDFTILLVLFGALVGGELGEFLSGVIGAKKQNASRRALKATLLGTSFGGILGTMLLPVVGSFLGGLLGGFLATYLAEYSKTANTETAKRVAMSVMKGQIFGTLLKIAIAIGMAILTITQLQW